MKLESKLKILPFGAVDDGVLKILTDKLGEIFTDVKLLESIELLKSAYDTERDQYHAKDILKRAKKETGERILGVTDVDLFVPELNFVFGLAERPGKAAVISLVRLHSRNHQEFISRMLKEAVHELGHTFGLSHCPNKKCVMHFSNSLLDTDIKGEKYCGRCQEYLAEN